MKNIYIDESGSMTNQFYEANPYFVIALVVVNDNHQLKRVYKRFVSSNYQELKDMDIRGKMFRNDSFAELKGSEFTPQMKKNFVSFFCQNNLFEVFYIRVNNRLINQGLYANTSRAFNYVLKLAMEHFILYSYLPEDAYTIQIDERNEKTGSTHFLEDYLNTELLFAKISENPLTVKYYDSADNCFVQIADIFANLYFSNCLTGNYENDISFMKNNGYLKFEFEFPYIPKRCI